MSAIKKIDNARKRPSGAGFGRFSLQMPGRRWRAARQLRYTSVRFEERCDASSVRMAARLEAITTATALTNFFRH
jgi:hypothetical protein